MRVPKRCQRIVVGVAAGAMLAGGAAAFAPPVGAAVAARPTPCVTERWPAETNGRPAPHPLKTGVYVWHESDGWHLRVNEPGPDRAVFTGKVSTDGKVLAAGRHLENHGEGTVSVKNKAIRYRFVNYGGLDGMDFVTGCASRITVSGSVDGHALTADEVYVGADGHHPGQVPFDVVRVAS